ncbi:MAG: DUF2508 family protein [Firmicutes bacterium]|nr:DUF2508 family protein [Bacillota bacterium]
MGQAKRETQWEYAQHEQLVADIAQAHTDWTLAMEQFDNATAADVIDDAIYLLIAAERRYEGLLRVARRQRLVVDLRGRVLAVEPMTPASPSQQVVEQADQGPSASETPTL